MASNQEITITLVGGRKVDAQLGRHVVHTDQPVTNGGTDTAPSPFDLFLASLGACAGIFIQGFCARREIPFEGITLGQRAVFDEKGVLTQVELDVRLPPGFPEKYREAVVSVAEQCSVKKAIAAQPQFVVKAVEAR